MGWAGVACKFNRFKKLRMQRWLFGARRKICAGYLLPQSYCSRMTIITAVYPITPAIASNSSQAGNAAMRGSEAAGRNLIPGPLQLRMGILHFRGLRLTATVTGSMQE